MSNKNNDNEPRRYQPDFTSPDCVDIVINCVGNPNLSRPTPPQLLAELQAERDKVNQWIEQWKQQPGNENKEPDFSSLDCLVVVDSAGDKTVRPIPPDRQP